MSVQYLGMAINSRALEYNNEVNIPYNHLQVDTYPLLKQMPFRNF